MAEPVRGWRTFYAGQAALCPGVKLGKMERRQLRERRQEPRPVDDRRDVRPAPEALTNCRAVFVRVGIGEIYRICWLGDRWDRAPLAQPGSTSKCSECGTVFQIQVERASEARAS